MAIMWILASILCPCFVGVGVNMLSLSPPDFRLARCCFWISAGILGGTDIVWHFRTTWPIGEQLIVSIPIWLVIGIGLPAILSWTKSRERLVFQAPLTSRPQAQVKAKKDDYPISLVESWAEDGILYVRLHNTALGADITRATAEVTYYDSRGRPYRVMVGIWRESGQPLLETMRTVGTLILAATTDVKTIFAPQPNVGKVDLKSGKGFISIRLHFTLYGNQPSTQPPFLFSVRLGKQMNINEIDSIPLKGRV